MNEKVAYTTFQPGIQFGRKDYREWNPGDEHIGLMYQFRTDRQMDSQVPIIPDASFDLLICCDPIHPSIAIWTSPVAYSIKNQPDFVPDAEYFCVRFLPEQYVLPINESMKSLNDLQAPLHNVMNLQDEEGLLESIATAKGFEERIRIFQNYMRVYLQSAESRRDAKTLVNYLIGEIYRTKGTAEIHSLAEDTGYSERYIRKKFEEQVGFSPKLFAQIVRFQGAIQDITRGQEDLTQIAHKYGYYDQAHLIKEFKKFTNYPPSHYRNVMNYA
jgi:AraC-like DNA-binding protein